MTGQSPPSTNQDSAVLDGHAESRAVRQLRMLHSLASKLNRLNTVRDIGETITEELHGLIDYHNCRVFVLQDDAWTLLPIAFRGTLSEYQGETYEALVTHVGRGVTGHVAETGQRWYAPDANNDPYATTIAGTVDLDESLLAVPMTYGDRVTGVIVLSRLGIDQFDEADIRVLESLAASAAVAVENARLLQRERSAAATARALVSLSKSLSAATDVRTVLDIALGATLDLIPCRGLQTYLRDPETGGFGLAQLAGFEPDEAARFRALEAVPSEVAGPFLLDLTKPFLLPAELVAQVPEQFRAINDAGELLVLPLRWEPDGFGALVTFPPLGATFTSEHLELAAAVSDIASLALANATRFEREREAADQLRAIDRMKNTFLEAVSHDLRTPLTSILGSVITVRTHGNDLAPEIRYELLGSVEANARKLQRLLSDLLDIDRLERGVAVLSIEEVRLDLLIERTVAELDHPTREVRINAPPVTAAVDAGKVERIIENLVVNAIRHTPADATVWVRLEDSEREVTLVVEDDGPGVEATQRENVFQPFIHSVAGSNPSPGVGIGLSLVARFAELHGGRAWVEDRPGGGASFRVAFPRPS